MSEFTKDSIAIFSVLAKKAEPKLKAALAERGVSSLDQLPPDVSRQIFANCIVATAAESFPEANLQALRHGMNALSDHRFQAAFSRLRATINTPIDAFEIASGVEAAIALAAMGLPVAPFDRKAPHILTEPSKDLDTVAKNFGKWKTAYVGYSPCDIPFYMVITDCIRTTYEKVMHHPRLGQLRTIFERLNLTLPSGTHRPFEHALMLIPREPGDTFSTIMLDDPNPDRGSVALYAGWNIDGVRYGAPNEGFLPVPMQFLRTALREPEIAMWIWHPIGIRNSIH